MEVHSNNEISQAVYSTKKEQSQGPVNNSFGTILDDAIAGTPKSDTGVWKPPMVDYISGIPFNAHFSLKNEDPIIERTEKLLDTLDDYREKLQDPKVSLENIYPLVRDMEMQQGGLTSARDSLPDGHGLKDILNEAMITSSIEVAKFNRGDYGVEIVDK